MERDITSELEMRKLGQTIGRQLHGGEVIELVGDIGAGKTTLTKGIAAGLGVDEEVQSPSFTISRTYQTMQPDVVLAHYDFYRLTDPGVMADELSEVVNDAAVITIVEWAEIVDDILPEGHIRITIVATDESTRHVSVEGVIL